MDNGYVKFHRTIGNWAWYTDPNTFKLFFHLILFANYADKNFCGITIKRGQIVRSYSTLVQETGLSVRNIRTALEHLKETGELTVERHANFSVITIKNYDEYQAVDSQSTEKRQSGGSRPTKSVSVGCPEVTGKRHQDKNNKNNKKNKNNKNNKKREGEAALPLTPAQKNDLSLEFGEKTVEEYIKRFKDYCEETNKKYPNPAITIRRWILEDKKKEADKPKESNKFCNYTDTNKIDFKAYEEQSLKEMLEG